MPKYFICRNLDTNHRLLYKVVKDGDKNNKLSKRQILKIMEKTADGWQVKPNAFPFPLVYGKLKGFAAEVSNKDILDAITECNPNISKEEMDKDFHELREYFNTPLEGDIEVWHKCGDTVLSKLLWTPFDEIPSDM